jgi:hypothetical protein
MSEQAGKIIADTKRFALNRYAQVMGEPFPLPIRLTPVVSDEFVALARPNRDGMEVLVSEGVINAVTALWHDAMALSDSLDEELQLNVGDVDQAIESSLMFLILHELHHGMIGHLTLVSPTGISETKLPEGLGFTRRASSKPSKLAGYSREQILAILRCIELQADHDALEILLGHYAPERGDLIRYYMATAMAVMILIDQQDQASDDERTHPKSATRIFQLFGSLATLWQPRAKSDWEAPDTDEIMEFHAQVVAPAIADAIILASAAGITPIVASLQDADALFEDMRMLQEPDKHDLSTLNTEGAREYAELLPLNALAIELLGPEKFSQ